MSKHQYAFGRLENRRDRVRSVIVPRRLKGLLAALGGAVLLVLFAAIAFALVDRSPSPSTKPLEKTAGAAERPGFKPMGASSRPKTDLRQPQAAIQPRVRRSDPVPEAPVEPRQAQAEPLASLPASAPAAVPAPVRTTVAERMPTSEPPRTVPPPQDITASVIERPDHPAEPKPVKDAGWPVVPKQAARGESSKAPTDCLPGPLQAVLRDLQARFGPVTIVSTTHLNSDNHTAGTIRDKLHQACKAVDIRANRDPKEVIAFLKARPEVGGINSYRNQLVHFDLNANYKPGSERTEATASTRAGRR
jgi:hypothetical protein